MSLENYSSLQDNINGNRFKINNLNLSYQWYNDRLSLLSHLVRRDYGHSLNLRHSRADKLHELPARIT